MPSRRIVREGSGDDLQLRSQGWIVAHRSFGAQLDIERVDATALLRILERTKGFGTIRTLTAADVPAVLELDRLTLGDYPGGHATAHAPLTTRTAEPTLTRRAFGFDDDSRRLVAMTFIDIDIDMNVDGSCAETDFTVVARDWRRRGVGSAVKAASVLAMMTEGVRVMRTGGSAENAGIIAANAALGYRIDEEWVTLEAVSAT